MDRASDPLVRGGGQERRKKTAALKKKLRAPIEKLQKDLQTQWRSRTDSDKPSTPPQLIIDHFSFEELHSVMRNNGGQMLGLFNEMSTLYGQLDLFKHSSSTMDRKTLITLNGGGLWSRNYRSYSADVEKTAFNIAGTCIRSNIDSRNRTLLEV